MVVLKHSTHLSSMMYLAHCIHSQDTTDLEEKAHMQGQDMEQVQWDKGCLRLVRDG